MGHVTGRKVMSKNLQYITDEAGNKTAVILSIEEYEELLEDLHMTRVAEETRGEERIPWEQVKAELTAEGKLSGDN
jgi:ABC-type uncharacterized transport system ATPase subunit